MKRKMLGLGGLIICLTICLTCLPLQANAQPDHDTKKRTSDTHLDVQQYMEILGAAITTLQGHYVDTINWSKVLTAGTRAMLAELDPYCDFITEEDQGDFKTMTTGEYGGIGALIQQRGDSVMIANPYEGRPAQQAGVRVGDMILAIDGESMIGKTVSQVSEKLRGPSGTEFQLKLLRPYCTDPIEFTIKRRKIVLDAVPYYGWLNDSVAYISLNQFTDKAAQDVQTALIDLRQQSNTQPGRQLQGLVFDLRGNPGGLLDEAVKIVGMLVPKGSQVVETKGKRSEGNSTYRTNTVPIEPKLRIVCLTDRNSASAAEILSGTLQDLDRAVVMGERSYGKGLVQNTRPLPYNTLIKFTSAKYYIPSGRCIQAIDYSQRGSHGATSGDTYIDTQGQDYRIPDSLTNVFHTQGGREVRDGGGIKPDIEQKPQQMSKLAFYLQHEYVVHEFANRYCHEHDTIAPIGEFTLSDEDYNAFREQALASRKDSILRLLLITDMAHELDSLRAELQEDLESEIVLRYYYQRGQAEQQLRSDTLVQQAAQLVADETRYEAILNPKAAAKKASKTNKKKKHT